MTRPSAANRLTGIPPWGIVTSKPATGGFHVRIRD